jgi:mannose-6-phosphate isomerase-like protein (cupin superfamily)
MLLKDGAVKPVDAGAFLLLRKDEIHMLKNTGKEIMKAICFYSSPTDNSKYDFYDMKVVEKPGV